MRIPKTLFFFILQNREISHFPKISILSVTGKRRWENKTPQEKVKYSKALLAGRRKARKNRTPQEKEELFKSLSARFKKMWKNRSKEERAAFCVLRSKTQKEVFNKFPKLRHIRAKSFRKVTLKYWATVSEEKKKIHLKKVSVGMQKAWDESDENFPSLLALEKLILKRKQNGFIVEKDLPRINDYAGVITLSDLETL